MKRSFFYKKNMQPTPNLISRLILNYSLLFDCVAFERKNNNFANPFLFLLYEK